MNIQIHETGEIKALSIVDGNGIDWTADLVGNADAVRSSTLGHDMQESVGKGYLYWHDEEEVYIASQDTYNWWRQYISDHNATEGEAEALAEELGIDLADVMERIGQYQDNDYEQHRERALQAMQELREQHATE